MSEHVGHDSGIVPGLSFATSTGGPNQGHFAGEPPYARVFHQADCALPRNGECACEHVVTISLRTDGWALQCTCNLFYVLPEFTNAEYYRDRHLHLRVSS